MEMRLKWKRIKRKLLCFADLCEKAYCFDGVDDTRMIEVTGKRNRPPLLLREYEGMCPYCGKTEFSYQLLNDVTENKMRDEGAQ